MSSKKILLVEDDPDQIALYKEAFQLAGLSVEVARNGEEGIKKVKKELPDLVILDIVMEEVNGIEVLEAIRGNPRTKKIPVLILTNLVRDDVKIKVRKLGIVDYLVKTNFEPYQLAKKIKHLLKIK